MPCKHAQNKIATDEPSNIFLHLSIQRWSTQLQAQIQLQLRAGHFCFQKIYVIFFLASIFESSRRSIIDLWIMPDMPDMPNMPNTPPSPATLKTKRQASNHPNGKYDLSDFMICINDEWGLKLTLHQSELTKTSVVSLQVLSASFAKSKRTSFMGFKRDIIMTTSQLTST